MAGLFSFCFAAKYYLLHLQVADLQVSGVQFLESQTHFAEHAFAHFPLLQQPLSFPLSAATAAIDNNMAVPAASIKILRFITKKLKLNIP
jgi:hypothetical protein